MADVREDILARLVEIAAGITGVVTANRNELSIDDEALPAVSVLDADEQVLEGEPSTNKANTAPVRVVMTPELLIKVSDADSADNIGKQLNVLRARIIKAVLEDATLATLATNAGRVRYLGCSTQLGVGRAMLGEMALAFGVTYLLKPPSL